MISSVRFRFAEFVLSPRRRTLFRNGEPVALIPKYFDLLVLLIQRRRDAVSKQAIFADIWSDVVVTDGALAQAIRTLRRTLGDDVREAKFIRTVSRHGYQFVWPDVIEESDDGQMPAIPVDADRAFTAAAIEPLVDRLVAATNAGNKEARDLAEQLHALGTDEAVARLITRPHHAPAVAMMRDARWTVPEAGAVPLLRDPEAPGAILALVRLRFADIGRTIARRWSGAALAGAIGGMLAGVCGGLALYALPMSNARPQSAIALAAIGAAAGGIGAAAVAAGLVTAEVLARSRRGLALVACGGLAGGVVALAASVVLRSVLDGLFGLRLVHSGGPIDGLVIGAAAGAGYALATSQPPGGGLAAPRGKRRFLAAVSVGAFCAAGGVALALAGRPLIGGLVHDIARSSRDAELELAPLGRLIGEPDFGPIARATLSAFEGATFGFALTFGLTRRPVIRRDSD